MVDLFPAPVSRRAQATVERLLEVAIRHLHEHGDSGLRIEDVLAEAEVSTSSLYHHFGNRDGLINAARAYEFGIQTERDSELLRTIFDDLDTPEEVLERMQQISRSMQGDARARNRRLRAAILGRAAEHPALWAALGEQQSEHVNVFAESIRRAQARGLIRRDLDSRAIAAFAHAYTFGRILDELTPDPAGDDAWSEVLDAVVETLVRRPSQENER